MKYDVSFLLSPAIDPGSLRNLLFVCSAHIITRTFDISFIASYLIFKSANSKSMVLGLKAYLHKYKTPWKRDASLAIKIPDAGDYSQRHCVSIDSVRDIPSLAVDLCVYVCQCLIVVYVLMWCVCVSLVCVCQYGVYVSLCCVCFSVVCTCLTVVYMLVWFVCV